MDVSDSGDLITEQDSQLENQIYKLNGQIRQLNTQLGVHSPQFTTDLQYHRKVKKDTHPKNYDQVVTEDNQIVTIQYYSKNADLVMY
jgi:hypothetical protein